MILINNIKFTFIYKALNKVFFHLLTGVTHSLESYDIHQTVAALPATLVTESNSIMMVVIN